MPRTDEQYDVVVVGAGHAGCEAAMASARLGRGIAETAIPNSDETDAANPGNL